jgi:prepilin-type N-terminal cleavage/methylation domain-containing protein
VRRDRRQGFTLIELVVTTTILAILAVSAVPMFVHSTQQKLRRAAHELAMNIKLARDLAVSTHRKTWVSFDVANSWYQLYIESPTTPGRANRIDLANPVTGASPFRVSLNQGDAAGVVISSASFGGRQEVEFDLFGKPYDGMDVALAADGAAILAAGSTARTVTVVDDSGMVREQ